LIIFDYVEIMLAEFYTLVGVGKAGANIILDGIASDVEGNVRKTTNTESMAPINKVGANGTMSREGRLDSVTTSVPGPQGPGACWNIVPGAKRKTSASVHHDSVDTRTFLHQAAPAL
jgi:hypothetical protein